MGLLRAGRGWIVEISAHREQHDAACRNRTLSRPSSPFIHIGFQPMSIKSVGVRSSTNRVAAFRRADSSPGQPVPTEG